jgi:hypothetical protein
MLSGASDTASIDTHCKQTILAGTYTNRDGFYSRQNLDQSRGDAHESADSRPKWQGRRGQRA